MGFVALSCLAQDKELDFGREVRPILSEKCFHCHGQDARTRMAGLRLDVAGADLRKVVERITATNPARRMPPPASKRSLEPAQIALLQRWVRQGGQYAQHWAFVPPRRPTPPPGAVNPIDAFVRQRLAAEGLRPNPPATPQAWLRRPARRRRTGLSGDRPATPGLAPLWRTHGHRLARRRALRRHARL
jgi:hypothetical protein